MQVEALAGGTQGLPVLGAVLVLVALALVVVCRAPRLAFAGWIGTLCFVPVWVSVSIKVGLEAHVVASVGLVASLLPLAVRANRRVTARLSWGDGIFVLFVLTSLVPVVSGRVTFSDTFVVAVQWTAAFLAGRLVGYRLPLSWVFGAVTVAFSLVAALALVEFLTGWNPFLHIPGDSGLRAVWAVVQERGGRPRAEGAFGHSIALGACLALAVPIALAAPFRTGVRVSVVVLMLAACVVTFSRIGLVTGIAGAALAVVFLHRELPRRLRIAATASLVVLAAGCASLVSEVFSAAGSEASDSADYRLELLRLVPSLRPFGWASTAYQLSDGQVVFANVPTSDGLLHSIDNALLLVGLSYGWVPMTVVLVGLLFAVGCLLSGRVTAPTLALVAQIPAFATVALITQYSTFTWFIAGLAVFSQSVASRRGERGPLAAEPNTPAVPKAGGVSPELVHAIPGTRVDHYRDIWTPPGRSGRSRGRIVTLHKFLTVLRRRKWMVAAVLLLALLGSGALSALATRTYTATAGVYFSVRTAASVNDLATAATFSQSQMASYATLAMTPEVLDPVATELGVRGGGGALAGQLSTTAVAGTVLLDVSAVDTDPARAARIANAVARRVITVVEDLSPGVGGSNQSAVEATVVTPASAPSTPTSPKVELNLVSGAVLGLGLGILLALALEALDTRVRRPEDVAELTRAPVLGSLGIEPGRRSRVLMEAAPHSPQAEAYRQLRTNLQFLELGEESGAPAAHRTISVTSALAGEGKSTVAINLAVALAETGARVLLVDADLRRPTIASVLGLEGAAGLTTVLLGQAGLDDVTQPWGSAGLHVLPAGPLPPNPTELLGSVHMRRLLGRTRDQYDYVVLDSAPLLPVADSAVVAGLVDGTLLLVNATKARRHQVAESVRTLARVEAPVLGVVLNQIARDERSYGYWATEEPTAVRSAEQLRPPGAPAPVGR